MAPYTKDNAVSPVIGGILQENGKMAIRQCPLILVFNSMKIMF